MTTRDPAADGDHDAWLREALRHAPDAELAPPQRLRAQILRAADEAARPRVAWSNPLQWFAALASHPGWAGGIASVFVATIVVAIWSPWSDGPDTTIAEAPAAPMSAASDAVIAAAPPEAPVTVARSEPAPEPKLAEARRDRAAERSERESAAKARTETKSEVAAAPPAATSAESARQAGATADRAALAAAPAAAPAGPPLRAADAAPLAAPRQGLRTEPDMWTWRRGGGEAMPADDALREWLGKPAAPPPRPRQRPHSTGRINGPAYLRIEADGVSRRGSVRGRGSLDAAAAASLAQELRQLAP